jgi:transcriptional regulator with XRE-family HTH domain
VDPGSERYLLASLQLLRALRGARSQVAFARRLGYRGNPITDWERGARKPTAIEALRAAERVGLDVRAAFARFVPITPPEYETSARGRKRMLRLGEWLDVLRGDLAIVELAQRVGRSRFGVGRWLAGRTQPRLDELIELIDAITGRAHDWVAELVPIESVPSLLSAHLKARAARLIAFDQPWTEAVLRVLETTRYREQPDVTHEALAAWLGTSLPTLEAALAGLVDAGVIEASDTGYRALRPLSVDTRSAGAAALRHLQVHWLGVALGRAQAGADDWFAYNTISCNRADLALIEDCLKRAYREIRSIVAGSEPSEVAALVLMQLVKW